MFGPARRAMWGVTAGVLVLAGCTVERPNHAAPERDEPAVLAALRQVDACALLDPVAARAPGFAVDRAPRPSGPHRCELTASGGERVTVRLGMSLTDQDRLGDFYPRSLGGAKAYVERWTNRPPTMCFLHLPVSRGLSIRFGAFAGTAARAGDLCAMAAAFAGVAVDRLARPETLRSEAPMADWDPCAMLATALDDGYRVGHESAGDHGIDGCVGYPDRPAAGGIVRLTLAYGPLPDGGPGLIAGRRVRVSEGVGRCVVRWSNGPAGVGEHLAEQLAEVFAPDCAGAERLAAAVLAAPTTAPAVTPQRPLLYRPDESDLAVAGACAFYATDPARCRPHVQVQLPGIPPVLRAAAVDVDVMCVLARDPVREHAGTALRPVTDDEVGCVFVEPTRTVRVIVGHVAERVSPGRDARRTRLAGATAWVTGNVEPPMAVRRVDVPLRQGTLSVTVHIYAEVGATRDDRPDPAHLDIAEAVARDVMADYLS